MVVVCFFAVTIYGHEEEHLLFSDSDEGEAEIAAVETPSVCPKSILLYILILHRQNYILIVIVCCFCSKHTKQNQHTTIYQLYYLILTGNDSVHAMSDVSQTVANVTGRKQNVFPL